MSRRHLGLTDQTRRYRALNREMTESELNMIADDQELRVTMYRTAKSQRQVAYLRQTEADYHASMSGFIAEI